MLIAIRIRAPFSSILLRLIVITASLVGTFLSRADVAVLREKGPLSAAAFSNPGLVDSGGPGAKIAMRSADVRIRLTRGTEDTLIAKCEAEFDLVNTSAGEMKTEDILVAFPVTGLTSNIVTVRDFAVTVDDQQPATVLRRTIAVSRRQFKVEDKPIFGQLDAHFHAERNKTTWGVTLTDQSVYPNAYVWAQATKPGATSRVKVSYSATLRPQPLRYSKSYVASDTDSDVIPFADLAVDRWNDNYYFFDYILLSGSTWEGPIGREKITLTIDPELHLSPHKIESLNRRSPIGHPPLQLPPVSVVYEAEFSVTKSGAIEWNIPGKPFSDILIAIPKSAVGAGLGPQ